MGNIGYRQIDCFLFFRSKGREFDKGDKTMTERLNAEIEQALFSARDEKYRDFQGALLPTVERSRIIGVRVPLMRKMAKTWAKDPDIGLFMRELPHRYYEENCIHAFVIEEEKDFDRAIAALRLFLPYVDNWAVCDCMNPKALGKDKTRLLAVIREWLSSDRTYTVRYAIGLLMRYYLDRDFFPEALSMVSAVHSDEYYVNMMIAWYFATALAKRYEEAISYIRDGRLSPWTQNKAIRKAIESYRVLPEHKEYLRTLQIKN